MEEDPDVRGGGRAAENKRITRYPDLADDRTSGAAEPAPPSSQQAPIQDKVSGSEHELTLFQSVSGEGITEPT